MARACKNGGERQGAILDAAQKRFAHYGISKATMDEIAADVGLGKASLYYYFPTKEDVFKAVLEREEGEFIAALSEITGADIAPDEKLEQFFAKRLELFQRLLNLGRFKADSWEQMKPAFQVHLASIEKKDLHILTRILREGIEKGDLCLRNPQRTATIILHVLHGLRLRVIRRLQTPDEAAALYTELGEETQELLHLLLTGMKKRTTARKLK
ncbi:MAG: TetR/AcrR family transcriptional regulator [Ignavibacteriales bacterium]|nr:TetR/AcrR family transcriptional regulator [Ignavibacteriales bacterium]